MASDPAPEADGSIAGVDYTPFNVFASRPLRRDDAIGNGDFVASTGTTGFVKIGDWQFARPFRALFFDVEGQIKRFELGLGGVTASTDEPNEIHSGGTVFKNTSTTYVIRVQGTKWGAKPQCTVLEGVAFVQDSSSATPLSGGNVLEWNDGGMHRRSVTDAEMAEHVDALVQGDIGRARFAGAALPNVDEIAGRLRMGYQGVFHAPESPADGYLTLAGARLEAGLVTEALGSVRHAAANVNALDAAANARIALTKAAAAAVRGKADASRSFLRAAYALDPALAKEESTATFFLPSVRGLLQPYQRDVLDSSGRHDRGPGPNVPPPRKPPAPPKEFYAAKDSLLSWAKYDDVSAEQAIPAWLVYFRESELRRDLVLPLPDLRKVLEMLTNLGLRGQAREGYGQLIVADGHTSRDLLMYARLLIQLGDRAQAGRIARQAADLAGTDGALSPGELAEARRVAFGK